MFWPMAMAGHVTAPAAPPQLALTSGLDSFAIVGARVETEPGTVLDKATIVVSHGQIAAVGEGVAVPAGYEVVDGKGLFVYSGFIDSGVTGGVKKAGDSVRQNEPVDTSAGVATSMDVASTTLHPSVKISDRYDPDDGFWVKERAAGFTTALLLPSDGIIKGQAGLINLSGRPRRFSCIDASAAMAVAFDYRGSEYPGTFLGCMATARQAFEDADWLKSQSDGFKAGGPRPPDDPELQTLGAWGRKPVLIDADEPWKIESVLRFAKEYKLNPVIYGASGATDLTKLPGDVPMVLKLIFNKEPMPDPAHPEPKAVTDERHRLWVKSATSAHTLESNGVLFGVTSSGVPAEGSVLENLRVAVKNGLSRMAALAALTTNPAKIFGVSNHLGTITRGKAANLTVLTGDFLDEKSKVKFLVADGIKLDPTKKPFKFDNSKFDFGGEN